MSVTKKDGDSKKINRFKAFLNIKKNLVFETEKEEASPEIPNNNGLNFVSAKAKKRNPFSKIDTKDLMEKPQDLSVVHEEDMNNVRSSLERRAAEILAQHEKNLLDPNHPAFKLIQAQKDQAILELAGEESDESSIDTDELIMTPDQSIELARNRPGNQQSGGRPLSKASLHTDDMVMSDGNS
eukprot:CAMPEP_0170503928 /NCGR_PEP_ID=MMETSP0208-20121228/46377_1 /TAXON_ID=197538 /ORGANISM="Strombidium inclinatum, Strain S3" /LENGTH=182 /DNA_ID=CAMNT_0010783873 /DNA_START=7905 /DNA_END=8456 /DNA_ORIENTATION=+